MTDQIWITRDYLNCTGCRRCEIACSLHHEEWIWPEASRIRVFMPFPGVEVPHFCAQCQDYPCIESCKFDAMSVDEETSAVIIDDEKCTSCALCIKACPGQVPILHPETRKAVICDLCGGDPECVKSCRKARYDALNVVNESPNGNHKLFAVHPVVVAKELAVNLFGEKGEEVI